jgi:ATP-dependent RNA helicase SUPV3L1/SUV3
LWSLARTARGGTGLDPLSALPGQGLTSVTIDQAIPSEFYLTAGFRPCGRRAVRIDMLERLADLIRERVFWKPQAPDAARPQGSVEGGGFTVIPDMMSLVGCSGEEFAEILKSLGFRVQRRPLPPAPPPSASPIAPPAQAPAGETASHDTPAAPAEPPAPVASEAPAGPALPVAGAAAAEPQVLEVWWPRDTGPFRRRDEPKGRKRHRPREGKPSEGEGGPVAAKGASRPAHAKSKEWRPGKRPPADRAPAKERAPRIDKDSPFAVLGELRSQLLARAKRGG